jgi:beta-lactam-binding protein with PASTA domain
VTVVYVASSRPLGIVVSNAAADGRERLAVSAGPNGQLITVPDERGQDPATAQSDLQSAGFTVLTVDWPVSDQAHVGLVAYQTPATRAPRGATIVVYVGKAP